MNWMPYLPPLLSIYVILTSDCSSLYLKKRIADFVSTNKDWADKKDVIQNIALDWAARVGFFSSMFTSLATVISVYSTTKSYQLTIGTLIVLLFIFIPMFWWIMSHDPDALAATRTRRLKIKHTNVCRTILIIVNLILIATIAINQKLSTANPSAWAQNATTVVKAEELAWKDHPVFPGAHIAILVGDPTKAGVVVQRVKFPPNYRVAPHTHTYAEVVTVISGTIGAGMGEKFEAKGEMLKPGSLFALPAKHPHYVWTTNDEAILQVQFTGPGGFDFINTADDPRKK